MVGNGLAVGMGVAEELGDGVGEGDSVGDGVGVAVGVTEGRGVSPQFKTVTAPDIAPAGTAKAPMFVIIKVKTEPAGVS